MIGQRRDLAAVRRRATAARRREFEETIQAVLKNVVVWKSILDTQRTG